MNLKDDDVVSAVALIVDDDGEAGEDAPPDAAGRASGELTPRHVEPTSPPRKRRSRECPCHPSPPFATLARPEKGGGPYAN